MFDFEKARIRIGLTKLQTLVAALNDALRSVIAEGDRFGDLRPAVTSGYDHEIDTFTLAAMVLVKAEEQATDWPIARWRPLDQLTLVAEWLGWEEHEDWPGVDISGSRRNDLRRGLQRFKRLRTRAVAG